MWLYVRRQTSSPRPRKPERVDKTDLNYPMKEGNDGYMYVYGTRTEAEIIYIVGEFDEVKTEQKKR